jgi:hypothetical protein
VNDHADWAVNPALALDGFGALQEACLSAFLACLHVASQGGCFPSSGLSSELAMIASRHPRQALIAILSGDEYRQRGRRALAG